MLFDRVQRGARLTEKGEYILALGKEMLAEMQGYADAPVFKTIIGSTVRLGEAPLTGKPITVYAPVSDAAEMYRELAAEVIARGQA